MFGRSRQTYRCELVVDSHHGETPDEVLETIERSISSRFDYSIADHADVLSPVGDTLSEPRGYSFWVHISTKDEDLTPDELKSQLPVPTIVRKV